MASEANSALTWASSRPAASRRPADSFCACAVYCSCGVPLPFFDLGNCCFQGFDLFESLTDLLTVGQYLIHGGTVLALEFFDSGQAIFDVRLPAGIEFEAPQIAAQFEGGVLDLSAGVFQRLRQRVQRGIKSGQLLEGSARSLQLSGRRWPGIHRAGRNP